MKEKKNPLAGVLRRAHSSGAASPESPTPSPTVRIAGHVSADLAEFVRDAAVHYGWTVGEVLDAAIAEYRKGKTIPKRPARPLKRGRRIG